MTYISKLHKHIGHKVNIDNPQGFTKVTESDYNNA